MRRNLSQLDHINDRKPEILFTFKNGETAGKRRSDFHVLCKKSVTRVTIADQKAAPPIPGLVEFSDSLRPSFVL